MSKKPQQFHAVVTEETKLIVGVADCFNGLVFRVFPRRYNPGDIVRGNRWAANGPEASHCRIMESANPQQLAEVQNGLRARVRKAGKKMTELGRWQRGFWYRVIED